jgi:hypothetical protein
MDLIYGAGAMLLAVGAWKYVPKIIAWAKSPGATAILTTVRTDVATAHQKADAVAARVTALEAALNAANIPLPPNVGSASKPPAKDA